MRFTWNWVDGGESALKAEMRSEGSDLGVTTARVFADVASITDKAQAADDAAKEGDGKGGQSFEGRAVDEHDSLLKNREGYGMNGGKRTRKEVLTQCRG